MLEGIKKALKGIENFSVESIGDIAYAMENKKKMKQLHAVLLITGIPPVSYTHLDVYKRQLLLSVYFQNCKCN